MDAAQGETPGRSLSRQVAGDGGRADLLQRAGAIGEGVVLGVGPGDVGVEIQVLVRAGEGVQFDALDHHLVGVGQIAAQGAGAAVDHIGLIVFHVGAIGGQVLR